MQDKRKTVLHLFHESAKPWLLKDVEKAAAKRGVVFQAVKDVVQSLIDDSLVHVDKIGTSNWYWSFPGEASAKLRHEVGSMDAQIAALEAECAQLDERLEKVAAEFPQTEERQMAEVMLQSATEENDRLKKELESFASGDAAVLETIRGGKENCHEAVNRWTDNTFLLKSWVEKKCGDREQAAKFFKEHGVNFNNFDYLE